MVHSVLEKMEPYCNWHSRSLRKYVMRWILVIIPESRVSSETEKKESRSEGFTSGSIMLGSGLTSLTVRERKPKESAKNLLHSDTIIEADEKELQKNMQRTRRRRKSQDMIIQKVRQIDHSWAELEGELSVFDFRKPIVVLQGKARVDYGLGETAEADIEATSRYSFVCILHDFDGVGRLTLISPQVHLQPPHEGASKNFSRVKSLRVS